jgi:putative oxygen-independent coproporphyrinogen III oxidase
LSATAAYIHIPFCRRRCFYCDFPIAVVGDRRWGGNSLAIQTYVEVIQQEISLTMEQLPAHPTPLDTVFFGGGTPSLLTPGQLESILAHLDRGWGLAEGSEISLEIDPGTFSLEQLRGYQAAGVNRFSLGVQAWQQPLLETCGRSHGVDDIRRAIDCLHQAEVTNWSLDLISGLPQQTPDQWQASLELTLAAAPTHVSVYDMILEAGTVFDRRHAHNSLVLPTPEITAAMYRQAQAVLTAAGYHHYEISNYARGGYACRHNQVYWHNQPYYGFGLGAASYLGGTRFTRPRYRDAYRDWVTGGAGIPDDPVSEIDRFLETLMLGLRTAEGLDIAKLIADFGEVQWPRAWDQLRRYEPHWVVITPPRAVCPRSGRLHLTDPEGFLYSNQILAAVFTIAPD